MCIWHMLSAGMHSTRVCVHMHTRLGLYELVVCKLRVYIKVCILLASMHI